MMALLEAVVFSFFWAVGLGMLRLEQPEISITAARQKSALIACKVSSENFNDTYIHWYRHKSDQDTSGDILTTHPVASITKKRGNTAFLECQIKTDTLKRNVYTHWYRQKPDQPLKRILYISSNENIVYEQGISEEKYEARKWLSNSLVNLRIHGVTEEDTDRNLAADMSPKPTIFLPSIAEINLHNTGTHLCLLEKFFPDAIKVYWKEKNGNTVLDSQQGDVIQTNDTYMKFSWLTVTQKSADKEHICIVKHENNKRGTDQEILFPSMNKEVTTDVCLKDTSGTMQLQLTNTSAYYTYLLLLLKSALYFAIITYCLFRETTVCSAWKRS